MRRGRRSPLKYVTACCRPSSEILKSSPLQAQHGLAALVEHGDGHAHGARGGAEGEAGRDGSRPRKRGSPAAGAGVAARRRRAAGAAAGATRRRATTSVSVAPAARSARLVRRRRAARRSPRSRSSARMVRSLMPAARKRTTSAVVSGSSVPRRRPRWPQASNSAASFREDAVSRHDTPVQDRGQRQRPPRPRARPGLALTGAPTPITPATSMTAARKGCGRVRGLSS